MICIKLHISWGQFCKALWMISVACKGVKLLLKGCKEDIKCSSYEENSFYIIPLEEKMCGAVEWAADVSLLSYLELLFVVFTL